MPSRRGFLLSIGASALTTGAGAAEMDGLRRAYAQGPFGQIHFRHGSRGQPLLPPLTPPKTFGVGPLYATLGILEITPIASYQASRSSFHFSSHSGPVPGLTKNSSSICSNSRERKV